jgi:hypothetical protein
MLQMNCFAMLYVPQFSELKNTPTHPIMTCETLFYFTSVFEIVLLCWCSAWICVIGFSLFLCPLIDSWTAYWKAKQIAKLEEYWQLLARIERLEKQHKNESSR